SHSMFIVGRPKQQQLSTGHTRIEAFASIHQAELSGVDAVENLVKAVKMAVRNPLTGVVQAGDAIPGLGVDITVRIWGGPLSRRADLLSLANWICFAKVPAMLDSSDFFATTVADLTVDLMGRYVEMHKGILMSGISRAAAE